MTTLCFKRPHSFNFIPGQYIDLVLPHHRPDERGISRAFTLSSSPTEEFIRITTKTGIPNPSTYTLALSDLGADSEVEISKPKGEFVLPDDPSISLIFCARGLGVTPFRSMTLWLRANNDKRDITLIYDVPSNKEVLFEDIFHETDTKVNILVHKRFNDTAVEQMSEQILQHNRRHRVYIAGSTKMVSAVLNALLSNGVDSNLITVDTHL